MGRTENRGFGVVEVGLKRKKIMDLFHYKSYFRKIKDFDQTKMKNKIII